MTAPRLSDAEPRWRIAAFAFLIGIALYRLAVIHFADVGLFYDEAQYYGWSLLPDFGYYSKPPMVAWLIALTTGLFGHSELAVKAAAPLLYSATAYLAYLIGRRLFDEVTGLAAAVALATIPGVGISALFITTDAPLIFFWTLTAYCFLRGRDSDGWGWWIAAGIAGGLGLLSKYSMIALPASLLVYLLASPRYRHLLVDARFWTAAALALAVFAPNIWWNSQHQFITLTHHSEISQLDRRLLNPLELLEFLVGQMGVIGPLLAVPFLGLLGRRRLLREHDGYWFATALALPLLALIATQALLSKANVNWALPAFTGATLGAVALLLRGGRRRWLAAAVAFNLALAGVVYHYHALADAAGLELSKKRDPHARLLGWPEVTRQVRPFVAAHPEALVAASQRKVAANLIYYAGVHPTRVAFWNPDGHIENHYELMGDMARYPGRDFVYVAESPPDAAIVSRFARVERLGEVAVPVYRDLTRRLHVYHLQGFKGYR